MCCSVGKWGALVALLAILVLGFTFYGSNGKATVTQNTSNMQGCDCADDHPNCHCSHCSGNGGSCSCEDKDKENGKSDMKSQEHPGEHPGKKTGKVDIKKLVEDEVSKYVKEDSRVKGMFLVFDPKENDVWMFKDATKYHPIRQIDDTHYFLCSDWNGSRMKDSKTHKVDLDFFLTKETSGKEKGEMEVVRVVVHKVDDVEYARGASCPIHKDVQMFCPACGPCPVCGTELKENKK